MKQYEVNWKRLLLLLGILLVLLIVLGLLVRGCTKAACSKNSGTIAVVTPPPTPAPTCIDLYAYYEWTETVRITVYDHRADKLLEMDLEAYILGVVAAEMPASYSFEALKAQAVASRTYALYNIAHGGSAAHPDAAVCTSSACCQAYADADRLRARWGDDYVANYNKVAAAVMETAGEVLVYDGSLIDALYHACSGGMTEDSEHIYANAIPYLRGVESPYETPMREDDVSFAFADAAALLAAKYPDAGVTEENIKDMLAIVETYPSGRVAQVRVGNTTITGKQLRGVFSLDSTMFTLTWSEDGIVFHTKGYGHGVGLSQNGANGMAQQGASYQDILLHYYTGVALVPYASLDASAKPVSAEPVETPSPAVTDAPSPSASSGGVLVPAD